MDKEERKILEVRTDSGELLLRLRMTVKNESDPELQKEPKPTVERKGGNGKGNGGKHQSSNGGNYPLMTDAQKRYLFRLLAGVGIEGEAAYEDLKKAFRVDNLAQVTKLEASQEIERRLAAQKGGGTNG
jgi:hypothetical protein